MTQPSPWDTPAGDPRQDLIDAIALVETNDTGYLPATYPEWMFKEFDQA